MFTFWGSSIRIFLLIIVIFIYTREPEEENNIFTKMVGQMLINKFAILLIDSVKCYILPGNKKFTYKLTAWNCPNTELFLVRIFLYSDWIGTEYGDLLYKSPYSVWIQENTDQIWLRIWTLDAVIICPNQK